MRGLFDDAAPHEPAELGRLAVIAGLDEAGLGPMLGPLTLGWCALEFEGSPPVEAAAAPWERLAPLVRDARPARGEDQEALVVADSKVLFDRSAAGHRRLERSALAFLDAAREQRLTHGAELLSTGGAGLSTPPGLLRQHPWYAGLASLPSWCSPQERERDAGALRAALSAAGLHVRAAALRVVPAGELNESFARTDNKSATVWEHACAVIEQLFRDHGARGLDLVVDRQGGRSHYESLLRIGFPAARVHTLREGRGGAEYVVREGERRMRLRIVERAEESSFCVAVGSCLAKYARELCMQAFNQYFAGFQEELRPTAGYVSDGRRWLREAREAVARSPVEERALVRER